MINDLIDQLTQKTLEIVDLKSQVDDAFKKAANAKTDLAQAKFEKVQLEDIIEQLRKRISKDQKSTNKAAAESTRPSIAGGAS